MKRYGILSKKEQVDIEESIASFEEKTKTELLIAIANKSDPYPASILRFSILSTFALSFFASLGVEFKDSLLLIISMFILFLILLLIGRIPFFRNLFLSKKEMEREVHEKAFEVFNQRVHSKIATRKNILFYISKLERKFVILFDEEVKKELPKETLNGLVSQVKENFSKKEFFQGLNNSIEIISEALKKEMEPEEAPFKSELDNHILWLKN